MKLAQTSGLLPNVFAEERRIGKRDFSFPANHPGLSLFISCGDRQIVNSPATPGTAQ